VKPQSSFSVRRAEARLDQSRSLGNAQRRRLALADQVRAGELPFYVARRRHGAGGDMHSPRVGAR